ncbi:tyrosine-type recombinase/integrase [Enterobacter asburiae]|uniref:tyrosine-type recombinase/integrase n=1 Tax=Enterobacter asburiae TaxID=61645 RepID=UPI003F5504EB
MSRKYLTENEVMHLLKSIPLGRNSLRDQCMITLGFYHGLRVSELTSLRIDDYDSKSGILNIKRLKNGLSTIHPVPDTVMNKLSKWLAERKTYPDSHLSDYLFLTVNGNKMTRQRFYQIVSQYGNSSEIEIKTYPHMLRHSCGYSLADRGNDTRLIQDYLGHKNIRHTVLYTASNAERFRGAWQNRAYTPS